MPRRLRHPLTRIPLQTHNRRIEKVIEQRSAEEAKIATRRERVNTALSVLANLFAIPALIIGLLTYTDQRQSDEVSAKKEAGRVNFWRDMTTEDNSPQPSTTLVVENRSLTSALHTIIVTKTASIGVYDYFDFSLVPPCTRETYTLGVNGKRLDAIENFGELELYFEDP
ncbi:hypothetical protein ACWDAZ_35930, partial [Streptomyces sp. NPDC001215]